MKTTESDSSQAIIDQAGQWMLARRRSANRANWRDLPDFQITVSGDQAAMYSPVNDALIAINAAKRHKLGDNPLDKLRTSKEAAAKDPETLALVQEVALLAKYVKSDAVSETGRHAIQEALDTRIDALAEKLGLEKQEARSAVR